MVFGAYARRETRIVKQAGLLTQQKKSHPFTRKAGVGVV